ncbi:MAG: hypothetical protein EXQ59_03890 [Acidobacteria bacterium]|nr:hypothetical protein [Acidobacteriota bacterium]
MRYPRRYLSWTAIALGATATLWGAGGEPLSGTFVDWSSHPAIAYKTRPSADGVADLIRRIESRQVRLEARGPSGYLRSVLDALNIPVESQILVFAPDSLQARRITSANPRAIYFNDSVSVAWVRGGFIELAAQDPRLGAVFYALDATGTGTPTFSRRSDCLTCHYSFSSVGVPGLLARSALQFAVSHRIPLDKRWGGWYVTGDLGAVEHLGNTDLNRTGNPGGRIN